MRLSRTREEEEAEVVCWAILAELRRGSKYLENTPGRIQGKFTRDWYQDIKMRRMLACLALISGAHALSHRGRPLHGVEASWGILSLIHISEPTRPY